MTYWRKTWRIYLFVTLLAVLSAAWGSRLAMAAMVSSAESAAQNVIVIDAGHGGEDGGTVSITGQKESELNLQIAFRLNDLLRFIGAKTKMIRTEDISVYTQGDTIAQKKVSDIHERVRIVEGTPNALLVSIHQNHFSESKYRGAQVFYAKGSEQLAETLQMMISVCADPSNHRQCKEIRGVYLFEHISCKGVLIECGFLSNPAEELLLRDALYQKKLAATIACCLANYLEDQYEI